MPEPTGKIQRYMNRPLDALMDELAFYHEQTTGSTYKGGTADIWDRLVPALQERVCVQWNWCQRRQDARFEENLTLAMLVAQVVAPEAKLWQMPEALIAVILVKKGLDSFCLCPPVGS